MSGTYILRKGHAQLSDLVDGGSMYGYPGPLYPGKNYYVNNITGTSGASGATWGDAMDQVSTAITASEAHQATHVSSSNRNIANNIFIQGTNTVYTGITDTGERSNFVGVSAGGVYDHGSGMPRIGSATDGDGAVDATNSRGNSWYNLQFCFGNTGHYGFSNTAYIQRSRFTECAFMMMANSGTACFNAVAITGTIVERCHFATNAPGQPTYGVNITGQNSDCRWVYNTFHTGTTALFNVTANGVNTLIAHNYFGGLGGHTAAFVDSSAGSYQFLAGNYFAHANITTDNIARTNDNFVAGNAVAGTADFVST